MTTRQFIVGTLLACFLGSAAFVITRSRLASALTSSQGELIVECKGTIDGWIFRRRGPDGQFHTPDDSVSRNSLTLPPHATVQLQLKSDDYLFRLAQKNLKLNTIAVPNQQITTMLETGEPGNYQLESQTMCGTPFLHATERPLIVVSHR